LVGYSNRLLLDNAGYIPVNRRKKPTTPIPSLHDGIFNNQQSISKQFSNNPKTI